MIDGAAFSLCLTHDVDRPYKRLHQTLYYAVTERSLGHLRSLHPGRNPYWQFEEIMALEDELGVRSAFYFLQEPHLLLEQHPGSWLQPDNWIQQLGRYELTDPTVADVIRRLDDGGWEVGLHGSYHSSADPERLRTEKECLENVLDHEVHGGRQHYLRLDGVDTWQAQADLGLAYDATLGSGTEYGFRYGYGLLEPIEELVVFPLTLMEQTLPDPGSKPEAAWQVCEELLDEAAENDAVMTVLFHPRYFSEAEFPGYRRLYRRLVERALEMGAWVGSPSGLLDRIEIPQRSARPVENE